MHLKKNELYYFYNAYFQYEMLITRIIFGKYNMVSGNNLFRKARFDFMHTHSPIILLF